MRDLSARANSRIVKSAVTPRPIGWVSTTSVEGVDNLAPFSCYNYVSSERPVLMFSANARDTGERKDTARNALETGAFVVNVVTEGVAEQMDRTSADLPPDESEFDAFGVERAPSTHVTPPRVADAVINIECTYRESVEIHDRTVVFGDVETFHVSEAVLVDGDLSMEALDTVGRLGGPYYTSIDRMELTRQF